MAEYFTNIVGNDALRRRMAKDILSNSLSHAHIIEGEEGSGKRTFALNIAAALCCQNRSGKRFPCLECEACRKILGKKTPDIITIGDDDDRATIGVDTARFIRTDSMTVPNDFERKIYIIENADTMTVQAQNALLLTLEEPHSYASFFLICKSAQSMLETVRSRAPVIRMEPIEDELLSEYIKSADSRACALASSSPEEYAALLKQANGSIGKALALLDPKDREPRCEKHELAEIFIDIFADNAPAEQRIEFISGLPSKRDELTEELTDITTAIRDLIVLKKSESAPLCFWSDREKAINTSYDFTLSGLFALLKRVNDAADALSKNANIRLTVTNLINN